MKFTANSDRGDERKVAYQLRYQWVKFVLEQIKVDWTDCFPQSERLEDVTILQSATLRKKLNDNNIIINDNVDGSLDIYVNEELIAEWKKPSFILHINPAKINKRDKYYSEIQMECWSVYDQNE